VHRHRRRWLIVVDRAGLVTTASEEAVLATMITSACEAATRDWLAQRREPHE
jgi:hypothetical protein